ncbi:hypothetical protein [Enterobacteriaceae endosymbiont of Donacia versicolorea]|uniref:hypothetical protein n=1 Tax=Enterobacteriaceae endosymbiont of Donacia versicolorea TaxID=2675788 RepID=UPI003CCD87CE
MEYIFKKIKFFINNIIKNTIFLQNFNNYDKINIFYKKYFLENTISHPIRTWL